MHKFTLFVFLTLLSFNTMSSDFSNLKEVTYPEGIITFSIPSEWVEEYDETEGVATFYEDVTTSGTLRLRVLSIKSPENIDKSNIELLLESVSAKDSEVKYLENGNAYKYYIEHAEDSGSEITIHYWSLAQAIEPRNARLANFSYTLLSSQNDNPTIANEIAFLTKQVESAKFSSTLINGI